MTDCPTAHEAQQIKKRLDLSCTSPSGEYLSVLMTEDEKQILRKILWHYINEVKPMRIVK